MEIVSSALPPDEQAVLNAVIGQVCTRIEMVGMQGCAEDYLSSHEVRGFHEVTWGVVLGLSDSCLRITWGEDGFGDPFRIAIASAPQLRTMESATAQDVSTLPPWKGLLGTKLASAQVHTYLTNYRSANWFAAPWGVELLFGTGRRLLVAAVHHGDRTGGGIAADEIVLFWSVDQIECIRRIYNSVAIGWRTD